MNAKVAIMQPYLFPYFGYFQLIAAADIFVIYDDTQFINRGWINRNRILVNGKDTFITLPLKKASSKEDIRSRFFVDDIAFYKKKVLKTISSAYARAPYFQEVFPVVESIIEFPNKNVAAFTENSIRRLCTHLGITTSFLISSQLGFGRGLSGTHRIVSILKGLHANTVINAIGGLQLYSCNEFRKHGIDLKFIKPEDIPYLQFGETYLPNLSVIDLLMFVKLADIEKRLCKYTLIDNCKFDPSFPDFHNPLE